MSRRSFASPVLRDYATRAGCHGGAAVCEAGRKARIALLFTAAACWAVVLVGRLYVLQLTEFSQWQQSALKQHLSEVQLAAERGPIFDRHGDLLAVSVPAGSVYARPRMITNKDEVAATIAPVLGMTAAAVLEKLDSTSPFVWIRRQVPRVHAERVEKLQIPGVGFFLESRRYYPLGRAASPLLGLVGVDGNGLSGLEAVFDAHLSSEAVKSTVSRDAFGNRIALASQQALSFELPRGSALSLTIDSGIQLITDEELEKGRKSANAKSAMAVLLDAETGEILAMSQAPSPNLNNDRLTSRDLLRNQIVETVFEPGSILKPLVAAAAIDLGLTSPGEVIDCESGRFRLGRHTINDVHPKQDLSVHQIVVQSSNIGMTKLGMRLGEDRLYGALRAFGFGDRSGLNLPGETAGILRPVSSWAPVDVATHSYGQGIAVTPLQVVRAVSAIANGGLLPSLKLLAGAEAEAPRRVLSVHAARAVREMMYGVVEDERGTGRRAAVEGVRVGGKTGTAQKARKNGRGYEPGKYIASFVGFVNGTPLGLNRTLTLLVAIDEPNTTSIYGGTLAGPVFRRIMHRTLHLLTTRNQSGQVWRGSPGAEQQAGTKYVPVKLGG